MPRYQDLVPGLSLPLGAQRMSEAALIAFAREFDPQPMHLDPGSAQAALMGGLIGSGWQSVAILHGMLRNTLLDQAGFPALLHVGALRWSAPVRPDDTLTATAYVTESATPAHLALRLKLANQHGETLLTQEAHYGTPEATRPALNGGPFEPTTRPVHPLPFDKIEPGTVSFAGEHRFDCDSVERYRALYDAKWDEGPITVPPWQLATQWLRLNISRWEALEAAGEVLPRRGPGLGLSDVIWPLTVHPQEPIRFFSRSLSARPSASRPGWGIVSNRNYALNTANEVVMAFSSSVLTETGLPALP